MIQLHWVFVWEIYNYSCKRIEKRNICKFSLICYLYTNKIPRIKKLNALLYEWSFYLSVVCHFCRWCTAVIVPYMHLNNLNITNFSFQLSLAVGYCLCKGLFLTATDLIRQWFLYSKYLYLCDAVKKNIMNWIF